MWEEKSQCHSWRDHFGTSHVSGPEAYVLRHIYTTAVSSTFTSSSWTIQTFSAFFSSSAGRGWFSGWFGRKWSKIGYIRPKAQQAAGEGMGGGGSESNERWQRIQIERRSRRRWKRREKKRGEAAGLGGGREVKDVILGNQDRESVREAKGVWKKERNGGLELFNYSTRRQQRPRFQETIRVCSPEGEAHLASFISPILSPHKLHVGIFNVFLLLHEQTQASLSLQMPRSSTWGGKSTAWRHDGFCETVTERNLKASWTRTGLVLGSVFLTSSAPI